MTTKVDIHLGSVQKTLLLPLWGRALETKKKHPLLVDPAAVNILTCLDFDFSTLAQNLDELTQIAWIRRSLFCDRAVRRLLARDPAASVVNIGCGLDTTFDRVDNGRLAWFDLDLPDVIDLRRRFIPETPRRCYIASSFLETDWLAQFRGKTSLLFIAAGVFYYFQEDQIREFILRLLETCPGCELLFDVCSPLGVRVANKKVVESSGLDERSHLTWGLKDKKDILAWDSRIRLLGAYYYFRTLRLSPRNLVVGALSDLLGIQYMLHLRLGS